MSGERQILVVDNDPVLCATVRALLDEAGYGVSVVGSATEMRRLIAERDIDLVLHDLRLPDESGLEVTRYLREHTDVAIIILTSMGEAVDRVVGLELGADDYISKPFDLRELLARVRSVLRRTNAGPKRGPSEVARFAGWQLDFTTRRLTSPEGKDVPLTGAEFALLSTFVKHPNRELNREQLLSYAHNREAGPYDRTIDVRVGVLRRKIEADPRRPKLIKTLHGKGYILAATVEYGTASGSGRGE